MHRRANGEGTIYQRGDGRWEGAAYVPVTSGGRRRVRVYGKTRKEAHEKITAVIRRAHEGYVVSNTKVTVSAFLQHWLSEVAEPKLRPSTYDKYRMYVRRYIDPVVGDVRLPRLSPTDVRRVLRSMEEQGLAPATVRQGHAILRAALQHAVREELLTRNVAKLVQGPSVRQHEFTPYDMAEATRFLEAAAEDRWYAAWALAIGLGLRKGELLGLRWADVELDTGTLRVRQTIQRVRGKLVSVPPKTPRSRRTLSLPDFCVEALRARRAAQAQDRLEAGETWRDLDLVFTTKVGTAIEPRNLSRSYYALLERAGLRRVRFHDLRHSCASLLLAMGVEPRVVMDVLGHSQIAVTMNTYAHVMPALRRDAALRMNEAFGS